MGLRLFAQRRAGDGAAVRGHFLPHAAFEPAAGTHFPAHRAVARLAGGRARTARQLAPGHPGRRAAGRGLCPGAVREQSDMGVYPVLPGGDSGDPRHLRAVYQHQHRGTQAIAAQQGLLLSNEALYLGFGHDLPHEAERRGPGQHLHPLHHGAGDGEHHHISLRGHERNVLLVHARFPRARLYGQRKRRLHPQRAFAADPFPAGLYATGRAGVFQPVLRDRARRGGRLHVRAPGRRQRHGGFG